jgi:hypothetical protein
MDVTPEHLVVALMRRVVDRLNGHEAEAVYLPEYDEPVSRDELVGIASAAVSMALVAMFEAVHAGRTCSELSFDELVTRCALRVMVAVDSAAPDTL